MVDGRESVKARLVAKGYQDPDLREGIVATSGGVTIRSSHLQVTLICADAKWNLRTLDIKNASLLADGFPRHVFRHAPTEWEPLRGDRVREPKAPDYC